MRIDRVLQRNTTKARSLTIGRNTLANLPLLAQYPNAAEIEYDGAAVVVGAGPSLPPMLDRLRDLQESGVLVVTVNTALPALHAAGIVPNVLVSIEPVDVTTHVRDRLEGIHLIVLDLSSNPEIWSATMGFGRRSILVSNSANNMRMCAELDIDPIEHGGSAMECAVSMVLRWGARTVGLVGVDLSFPGMQAYAPDAGWTLENAREVDDQLVWVQPQDRIDAHERSGVEPPQSAQGVHYIDHTDGRVPTNSGYLSQVRGLEGLARAYPRRNLVQTRGAKLAGWGESPELEPDRDDIAAEGKLWCVGAKAACEHERLRMWVALERRRCEAMRQLCDEIRSPANGLAHLALVESADLAETLAAGRCLDAHDIQADRDAKIEGVYAALRDAASEVLSATS